MTHWSLPGRLELPEGMNVAHAADALLVVAMSVARERWTQHQLLIVHELMVLAGREPTLPDTEEPVSIDTVKAGAQTAHAEMPENALHNEYPAGRESAEKPPYRQSFRSEARAAKQSKAWWQLVGRDPAVEPRGQRSTLKHGQRKTRERRASREP